jgi:hypothetical protein
VTEFFMSNVVEILQSDASSHLSSSEGVLTSRISHSLSSTENPKFSESGNAREEEMEVTRMINKTLSNLYKRKDFFLSLSIFFVGCFIVFNVYSAISVPCCIFHK